MRITRRRSSLPTVALCSIWLSGFLLTTAARSQDPDEEWPREIATEQGLVVLYQPQLESLEGNELQARAAVAVIPVGRSEPIFGATWLQARINTDLESRAVILDSVSVPRVRFPDASAEQERSLSELLSSELPRWDLEISLDRMTAMLEMIDREAEALEGFDDSAPEILFSETPTVLVSIDGSPRLRKYQETDLEYVINSPFMIVTDPKKKDYYMYAGAEVWYKSPAVEGPWAVTGKVPKKIRKIQPEDEEIEDEDDEGEPPQIRVTTEPTELIVTEGPPKYTPIAGGELLVVSNTEGDVLVEIATQRTFVLLSGRWFAGRNFQGPWEFVRSDQLPESFSQIDPESDEGYLLSWVAGTELANETVLDSYVPQTAAIKRTATIEVGYDGDPQFEPIEETRLEYAVNTESQVIRDGRSYYCAEEGVWYTASTATGPWRVATEVPDEIQSIPPSSPVYNTKYVHIYQTTPEVVYVGYYPGYTYSYPYHGSLVYGTGWYYSPYWGPYAYYPRHRTWGFSVRWNPWHGWGLGFSYSTGRFTFSIGYGGWYRRGWWGPRGYRGYRRGYNRGWHRGYRSGRRAGYRSGYRSARRDAGRNMYQRGGNSSKVANTPRSSGARAPTSASSRANNVFADSNGNVHRQGSDGNWQSRQDGKWSGSEGGANARSQAAGSAREAGAQPRSTPQSTSRQQPTSSSTRGSSTQSLNRSSQARSRGSQRSQSYRRSGGRSMSRGGGGGRRR